MTKRRTLTCAALTFLCTAAMCGALGMVPSDAVEKTRLEKMVADGDTGMVVAVFRRYPGETLPFIDRYLEGGLALIEKGGETSVADATKSFRTGIRFAGLADEAFGGTSFSNYANAFASWSPSEQKSFREGQRLFKSGMQVAKTEKAKAAQLLRESLDRARALGDTWGEAMANTALAELLLKGEAADVSAAREYADRAVELNASVQLREDLVQSLRLAAQARQASRGGDGGLAQLRRAWEILAQDPAADAEVRKELLEEYAKSLEQSGQKAAAAKLRGDAASSVTTPGVGAESAKPSDGAK